MILSFLADLVLATHAAFVVFVVLGSALALRWPRVAWAHVPCAVWGSLVVIAGWVCPLTPLEVSLRRAAGEAGYQGGFLAHWVELLLYPPGLTRGMQVGLGVGAVVVNVVVYALVARRARGRPPDRVTKRDP